MELRAGFKRTEFGLIPSEWAIRSISELIESQAIYGHLDGNHGALYPRSNEFKSHGVPYVAANDFANGRVDFGTCKFLSSERAEKFKKGIAQNGDVLFAHNATVGPVALLETNLPYVILSTTATYFRCNPNVLSNFYLLGALQSPFFVNQYKAVMAQSTRYQVPITAQRKLSLVVPPVEEQNAIATALSDVDALIAGLEKLIAKKRDLKQAAMQQLLTGQTRLPGFSGEWVTKLLPELADIRSGGTPSTHDAAAWDGDIAWCTPTDITALAGRKYLTQTERRITGHGLKQSSAEVIPVGSIVMTSRATIGECAINVIPTSTNQGFKNFVPFESVDAEFFYYLLVTQKAKFIGLCSGSTFLEIGKTQLRSFAVQLPSTKAEQTAIATVLSDMDSELKALETRLAKTRELKQGMMQELLTGRTRLI